jgi:hypothetical protein
MGLTAAPSRPWRGAFFQIRQASRTDTSAYQTVVACVEDYLLPTRPTGVRGQAGPRALSGIARNLPPRPPARAVR